MTFPIPAGKDIDTHEAGAVLDRLIAIHVFGRSDRHPEDLDPTAEKPRRRGAGRVPGEKVYHTDPPYSKDERETLHVIAEYARRGAPMTIEFDPRAKNVWAALVCARSPMLAEWGMGPTLAIAVCRAALFAQAQLAGQAVRS